MDTIYIRIHFWTQNTIYFASICAPHSWDSFFPRFPSLFGDDPIHNPSIQSTKMIRTSEILEISLVTMGSCHRKATSIAFSKRVARFKACFGLHPLLFARLWLLLKNHAIDKERRMDRFFLCLFWMKSYPTESVMAVQFDLQEETLRLWLWYYARCLALLSEILIQMPDQFHHNIAFPLAVDGTHCTCYEPMHDRFPMDSSYYSHKHHTSGFNYQVTVSTFEAKIYSVDGPYPAGQNDMNMFRDSGLEGRMIQQGKRAIADGGYAGEGVAVPNRKYHSKLTNIYFRRNRARMERTMAFFKNFSILSETFRIRKDRTQKHRVIFRAISAIAALQVEESLFHA